MDFFQREDHTRRVSRYLVLLFILAVICIVAAITFLALFFLGRPLNPQIGLFSAYNLQQQAPMLAAVAVITALGMALASVFRSMSLHGGGGKVARELGARQLDGDTRDPKLQQLQNVIEEVALAAGVPVPEIYVMESEDGINAFAAGFSPADAAITVTQGTLDKLNRDELQGVIAHEFSHILNGDMRLNIRLMGIIFGILVLAIVGQRFLLGGLLFGGGRRRGGGGNSGGAILAMGMGLIAVGYIGLFFGRWIKAAVARQRESLADASAVQFTRDPTGIAGALKKIAVYNDGSLLQAHSEEVNHMLFGEARAQSIFATHPPLLQRIQAIEPAFREDELETLAKRIQNNAEPTTTPEKPAQAGGGAGVFDVDNLINRIGQVDNQTLVTAAALGAQLPQNLRKAARSTADAPAVIVLLLLDSADDIRESQLQMVQEHLGDAGLHSVKTLVANNALPNPAHRLHLLDIALPALKRRSRQQLENLDALVEKLSAADHRISPFEFLMVQVLRTHLRDADQPHATGAGQARLKKLVEPAATTLAALADFGHDDTDTGQAAFVAGATQLQLHTKVNWSAQPGWADQLRKALKTLDTLTGKDKRELVGAWITIVRHDRQITPTELALLRAFCLTIHVPLPPLDTRSGSGA